MCTDSVHLWTSHWTWVNKNRHYAFISVQIFDQKQKAIALKNYSYIYVFIGHKPKGGISGFVMEVDSEEKQTAEQRVLNISRLVLCLTHIVWRYSLSHRLFFSASYHRF